MKVVLWVLMMVASRAASKDALKVVSMDEKRVVRWVEWTGQLKVDSTVDSWDVQMDKQLVAQSEF